MSSVKSPYNFVPAPSEEHVFKPNWADKVSHDIPFSDGESGEIELKITAETPIFIRNGHGRPNGEEPATSEFSHFKVDGKERYFIPATSIKGMLRNVLEIMSFSRMSPMNDHRHAIRQIMPNKGVVIDEGYELSGEEKKRIRAGYLTKNKEQFVIFDCGTPYKIRFNELDSGIKTDFGKKFGSEPASDMTNDFSARTGRYKYESVIGERGLEYSFQIHPLEGNKEQSWKSIYQHLDYVQFSSNQKDGSFPGRIVCVGQASTYNVQASRKGEYVFKGRRVEVLRDESKIRQVPDNVIEKFLFINRNNKGASQELEDWSYWKDRISEGIPVFYRMDNTNREVLDLGLTFMYKLPAKYSTKELLSSEKEKETTEADLAETVFGHSGLRGRVVASHFKLFGEANALLKTSFLLASPKSSFVPFYLKQSGSNGVTRHYNTYNTGGNLRGFKRYPVQSTGKTQNTEGLNSEMLSQYSPLNAGSTFHGIIRIQNLRKFEIGALLSSITLHNSSDTYHSLGGLKPFGYGRVKVEITSFKNFRFEQNEYMRAFELGMRMHSSLWNDAVSELLTTSTVPDSETEKYLTYMELKNFQIAKDNGVYLRPFTEIVKHVKKVHFLINNIEFYALLEAINLKTEEAKIALEKNELEQAEILFNEVWSLQPKFNLEKYIGEIKDRKAQLKKAARDEQAFNQMLNSTDVLEIEIYLQQNRLNKRIPELEQRLATLKAVAGIPDRLKKLRDFSMFSREASSWMEKVKRAGEYEQFMPEVAELIRKIIDIELTSSKLTRKWLIEMEDRKGNWVKVVGLIGEKLCRQLYEATINKSRWI